MRTETQIRDDLEKASRVADEITRQIEEAQTRAKQTGRYADSDWFGRAKSARRAAGREISRLQTELGQVKAAQRAQNRERGEQFARRFVVNANLLLPAELYQQILSMTLKDDQC